MSRFYREVSQVLGQHVSSVHAELMLRRGLAASGLKATDLRPTDLGRFLRSLDASITLFVPAEEQKQLRSSLSALGDTNGGGAQNLPRKQTLVVREESDITAARGACRNVAVQMGADGFALQKATTIVSELARNIASYSVGGRILLEPIGGTPARLKICAIDEGPGIRNLQEILNGKYKSKTGMGLGILGVKRLADDFTIASDRNGTRCEVEVRL